MKPDDHEQNPSLDGKEMPNNFEATEDQNAWCRAIFETLNPPEQLIGSESEISIENEPPWVKNVIYELMQQAAPAFSIENTEEITPKFLGRYLGQQCANLYAMGNLLREPTAETVAVADSNLKVFEQNRNLPGVESALKALEFAGQVLPLLPDYFLLFESALHKSFKAALEQPNHGHAVQFFQGFAKGISKPGIARNGLARGTTATLIYQKLFVHRREVEKLQNYPELKEFLIRNGVAKNVMGSLKRLQKLCERSGLHLAKRGRPSKS